MTESTFRLTRLCLIVMILDMNISFVSAQSFMLMRFDEDYSMLRDSTKEFYHRLKYIPLVHEGDIYLSLGGEIRLELDRARNEDWGAMNLGTDVFSLQRYSVHTDLHFGRRTRVFAQLRSGLEFGRETGPRKIDEDQLNVQNLFFDLVPYKNVNKEIRVRVGRQELRYGSGRLIDVRDGPNLRQYFDGFKVLYKSPRLSIDGFAVADPIVRTGVFDNSSTRHVNLWGVYTNFKALRKFNLDLYYLGADRANAKFDEGIANERRHTFGIRLWKSGQGFVYNFEVGYQLGKFGQSKIRSWGGSSEMGYVFDFVKGSPCIMLRNDFISGDKEKNDGKLGTFNALYPNGGYFGMNPQAGPANLISIHPNLRWSASKNFLLSVDVVFGWRQSLNDGMYRPDGIFNLSSSDSQKRYIGTAYIATVQWMMNRFLNFNLGVQYFKTGEFLNNVIPNHKDGLFIGSVLGFKF